MILTCYLGDELQYQGIPSDENGLFIRIPMQGILILVVYSNSFCKSTQHFLLWVKCAVFRIVASSNCCVCYPLLLAIQYRF